MGGYCTVTDVRDVFQDAVWNDPLDPATTDIVVNAIEGVRDTIERATDRHWYDQAGTVTSPQSVVSTAAKSRSDEYDIPTHAGYVEGANDAAGAFGRGRDSTLGLAVGAGSKATKQTDLKREIRLAAAPDHALDPPVDDTVPAYCRLRLARKDVSAINELNVVDADNSLVDWVASNDYDGGVGKSHRGTDFWIQVNSGGVSELYIDVHSLPDDIPTLSNAVYVDITYGESELPQQIRRAAAHMVASELVLDDEFLTAVPDNGQLTNVETKSQRWKKIAREKLEPDLEHPEWLME